MRRVNKRPNRGGGQTARNGRTSNKNVQPQDERKKTKLVEINIQKGGIQMTNKSKDMLETLLTDMRSKDDISFDNDNMFDYDDTSEESEIISELIEMDFNRLQIKQALKYIKPDFDKISITELKVKVLDWLCLHIKEDELPIRFRTGKVEDKEEQLAKVEILAFSDTQYSHHEEFIKTLISAGFNRSTIQKNLHQSGENQIQTLHSLIKDLVPTIEKQESDCISLTESEISQIIEDELLVLESMFGDNFTGSSSSTLWRLKMELPEFTLTSTLDIYFPDFLSYPKDPPLFIFRNSNGIPDVLLSINRDLNTQSLQFIGSSMVYSLVLFLQSELLAGFPSVEIPKQDPVKPTNSKKKEKTIKIPEEEFKAESSQSRNIQKTMERLENEQLKAEQEEKKRAERVAWLKAVLAKEEEEARTGTSSNIVLPPAPDSRPINKVVTVQQLLKRQTSRSETAEMDNLQNSNELAIKIGRYLKKIQEQNIEKFRTIGSKSDVNSIENSLGTNSLYLFDRTDTSPSSDALRFRQTYSEELRRYYLRNNPRQPSSHSTSYAQIRKAREGLPVTAYRSEILSMLSKNSIVLISGETGSGKTTQVPQFILTSMIEANKAHECFIIVTQPRRIAAVSVAQRVSAELGETCQIGDGLSGYQIRLENRCGKRTRLLFVTTGVLVRKLQFAGKEFLNCVSHIVVDEIHERSVDTEFLLVLLKSLVGNNQKIENDEQESSQCKLVLMSATMRAELFAEYFGGCPALAVPGKTFPVHENYLEDVFDLTGHVIDQNSMYAKKTGKKQGGGPGAGRGKKNQDVNFALKSAVYQNDVLENLKNIYPDYSEQTIKNLSIVDEMQINYDAIVDLIDFILLGNHPEYPNYGAILVFLPGLNEMLRLKEMLQNLFLGNSNYRNSGFTTKLFVLHSSLNSVTHEDLFKEVKKSLRKIVLATNIAETSITIPDVKFVIDTGKAKEMAYDFNSEISELKEIWVSKANVSQRKGRAGRTSKGFYFGMFTGQRMRKFRSYPIPEILRVSLVELILTIKFLSYIDTPDISATAVNLAHENYIEEFFEKFIEPPSKEAVAEGIRRLRRLGCLDGRDQLTPLGFHVACLPVDPQIGKMMLFGSMFCCLDSVLSIASTLADDNITWSIPVDKREEGREKKSMFGKTWKSDIIGSLKAVEGYEQAYKEGGKRKAQEYCRTHMLSHGGMKVVQDLKGQYKKLLQQIGFVSTTPNNTQKMEATNSDEKSQRMNIYGNNVRVVKAVVCAGLYPNVLEIVPVVAEYGKIVGHKYVSKPYRGRKGKEVAIHPSSVLNNKDIAYDSNEKFIVFYGKVKTAKEYVRDATVMSSYPLLLFGGDLNVVHEEHVIIVDEWMRFPAAAKVGVLIKEFRAEVDKLLVAKIEDPEMELYGTEQGKKVVDTIVSLLDRESLDVHV